jgi:hypothetical protein
MPLEQPVSTVAFVLEFGRGAELLVERLHQHVLLGSQPRVGSGSARKLWPGFT